MNFKPLTKRFEKWSEAIGFVRELGVLRVRFAFRGQANSDWGLQTSLERACTSRGPGPTEPLLISAFKGRAHQFEIRIPDDDDYLEWLALMQHFGAPTRLVDWTKSPYVAAYFAAEPSTNAAADFSIWAVDLLWLKQSAAKLLGREHPPPFGRKDVFCESFLTNKALLVAPVQAQRMNPRMVTQQGLFLCMGSSNSTFQRNLFAMGDLRGHLFKVDISHDQRFELLYELETMNINRATLFPDLEGFARSLGIRANALREQVGHLQQRVEVDLIFGEFGFV